MDRGLIDARVNPKPQSKLGKEIAWKIKNRILLIEAG
jgi:hypothetical protein